MVVTPPCAVTPGFSYDSLTDAVMWVNATTRPPAWLARMRWWLAGRIRPCRMSSARLHISFTGRRAALETRAASIAAS